MIGRISADTTIERARMGHLRDIFGYTTMEKMDWRTVVTSL